jgi:ribose transport system permease protein
MVYFSKKYTIVVIFFTLFFLFSITTKQFFTIRNLLNILEQSSTLGVICVGATFVMINGYRDLSVGMVMGLAANLAIGLQKDFGMFGILFAIAAGVIVGLLNGYLVAKVKMNSFIVTLATMLGVRSITYIYTRENAVVNTIPWVAEFAAGKLLGIPNLAWIFLILIIIGELVLNFTIHGRNTYAAGGNAEAANYAGIDVDKTTITNFVICSLAAVLGGILTAARMNSAIPELGWPSAHFMVIVMIVLGGTKMSGGYGKMFFTLGGVLTIGMLQNFLNLQNVHTYLTTLFTGITLIIVLYLDKVIKPPFQKKIKRVGTTVNNATIYK